MSFLLLIFNLYIHRVRACTCVCAHVSVPFWVCASEDKLSKTRLTFYRVVPAPDSELKYPGLETSAFTMSQITDPDMYCNSSP